MAKKTKLKDLHAAYANDANAQMSIANAEDIIIDNYFEMLSNYLIAKETGQELTLPDFEDVAKAIRTLNKLCANKKLPFVFDGNINVSQDLMAFAKSDVVDEILNEYNKNNG